MKTLATLLALTAATMLQGQVIVLTFEATYGNDPLALDSIRVLNLSQSGDTLISFPNSILVLGMTGLAEHARGAGMHVVPNPFSGSTELQFNTSASHWTLGVRDAIGRRVVEHHGQGAGAHRMRFQGGGAGLFILTLDQEGRRSSRSMMAVDEGTFQQPQLVHTGMRAKENWKNDRSTWAWTPGDDLRYIGYALADSVILSASIDEVPDASITHTFELAQGVVCVDSPTVTDIDGNIYPVVRIGEQCWMAENLRTGTYRNGATIPNVTGNTAWTQLNSSAWSNYYNSPGNDAIYGKLYTWYAAANPNLCPQGWHVPTDAEWQQLEAALGMPAGELSQEGGWRGAAQNLGGKMKTTTLWYAPNAGANNESGFSGLPGGLRSYANGYFIDLGGTGNWWSASESGVEDAWYRSLSYGSAGINREFNLKRLGFCVRCVRD